MDPNGGNSDAKGNKNPMDQSDLLKGYHLEDSSVSDAMETMADELQNFRERWQNELKRSPKPDGKSEKTVHRKTEEAISDEDRAKSFYLIAVDMEKSRKMYDAVKYYKKAFDLVPDIDFRYFESLKISNKDEQEDRTPPTKSVKIGEIRDDEDLYNRLEQETSGQICSPKQPQETTHISILPREIIFYILKWVVSQDLDMRSLDLFGQVCRGFYVCSRDYQIWMLACYKVWGRHNCKLDNYVSWRHMFLERPRLLFNGCYISKTTYMRNGENSFQDQFYRPWHLITYYRYFRFFPEGKVLMLTTSEEPNVCVSQLRTRTPKSPVLSGYYRLKDDRVSITVYRQEARGNQNFKRNTERESQQPSGQTFNIEFKIMNHKNEKHIQLQWSHFSIKTRSWMGVDSLCDFELRSNKFPPLWFSRVKSYSLDAELPLN